MHFDHTGAAFQLMHFGHSGEAFWPIRGDAHVGRLYKKFGLLFLQRSKIFLTWKLILIPFINPLKS
jgi:hypothetical protein